MVQLTGLRENSAQNGSKSKLENYMLQEATILYWVEDKDLWFWLFFFYQDF